MRKVKLSKKSILYLVQHENIPEYTKIGITDNLEKRLQVLNTGSPTGIKLIYSHHTNRASELEKFFIIKYSRYNSNGEWFKLDREQILDIIFTADNMIENDYKNNLNEEKRPYKL